MADGSSNPKPLLALSAALVVALLVIAFLVGRETARRELTAAHTVGNQLPSVPHLEREAQPEQTGAPDPWQQRDEEYANTDANWEVVQGIDRRPDGAIVLSNTEDGDSAKSNSEGPRTFPG